MNLLLFYENKLLCVGQLLNLGAEDLPLVKLVVSSGAVDVNEHLVVQRHGAKLVVGGGKELDHIMPIGLVLSLDKLNSVVLEAGDDAVKNGKGTSLNKAQYVELAERVSKYGTTTGKLPVNIPVYDFEANTYTDAIAYERGHGLTYEAKEVTEHVYTWTVVKEATCTEAGLETGVCAHGFTAEREIPALGHNYEDGTCTNCGEKEPVTNPFIDVPEGIFLEPVLWAVEKGITTGTSATTFSPFEVCNRTTVVTFLWRYMGEPEASTACGFSDVPAGAWFEAPINWAVEEGITNGIGNNLFDVLGVCNRVQVVTFLHRLMAK